MTFLARETLPLRDDALLRDGGDGVHRQRLARQLREAGHEVDAIAWDPGKAGDLTRIGVRVHRGDITDRESMRGP